MSGKNGGPLSPELVHQFREDFDRLLQELGKAIVGQRELLEHILVCFFAGGHVLLEGAPGLGKTLMVRTLAEVLELSFARIQFTPDLMPADIIGTSLLVEDERGRRSLQFQSGPIFANIVLADEINRATPKTQSALLECMQENHVTVSGSTYQLDRPFFVLGTQNPIEMEGTYPLPEAQLDRFFFKLCVNYPSQEELHEILRLTCSAQRLAVAPGKILTKSRISEWMRIIPEVYIAPEVEDYAVKLVLATHPDCEYCPAEVRQYVRYGASPRGAQAMVMGAKVKALSEGRYHVSFDDIAGLVKPALRHRILLNFEGESEGITGDGLVEKIVKKIARIPGAYVPGY